MRDLRKRFPQFGLRTQMDDLKTQEEAAVTQSQAPVTKPISITSTNITHMVAERLKRRYGDDLGPGGQKILAVLDKYKEAS
ncbi:hypothetical protein D3C76_1779470 [compost metagenome]